MDKAKTSELVVNNDLRKSAIQPMVDELKQINKTLKLILEAIRGKQSEPAHAVVQAPRPYTIKDAIQSKSRIDEQIQSTPRK